MNKSALKSFATEARRELLEKIQLQARKLGITPDSIQQATLESSDAIFIDGKPLSNIERKQRNKLISRINAIGYDRVMEEAAYTWFNRFIALRYMEVNDYLPTKVRVFSSVNPDSTEPDMMKEALNLDLPIDKEYIYNLKIENKTDELFKYLIKVHCNDLNRYMPFMFETIEGYTEVLFPEGLLGTDTFVRKMTDVENITEEDWTKVEIVGWLYQYYISEENERVIQAKKKYKKEEIPFATQLFTPEWIVRYMVQNALGRYWVESHPEHRNLIENWEFYLENKDSEADFESELAPYINKELNVENIKFFDPAMGSGHILVYAFDVFYEIYSKCGYIEREIPRMIIENNLHGLDIDDRAYQLACFSIVMKALRHNRRFLRSIKNEGLTINLASIKETNMLNDDDIAFLAEETEGDNFDNIKDFIMQFKNAETVGSLVKIKNYNVEYLEKKIIQLRKDSTNSLFEIEIKDKVLDLLPKILKQFHIINIEYDILVTNPPYMGHQYMNEKLRDYILNEYLDFKNDLFMAFAKYTTTKVKKNGHIGMLTPYVWMYISAYEKFREFFINNTNISSLIQLEYNSFPSATVPVCAFTLRNSPIPLPGEFIKLSEFKGVDLQPIKAKVAVENKNVDYRFTAQSMQFKNVPRLSIAYWANDKVIKIFNDSKKLGDIGECKSGIMTGKDALFLRIWSEVDFDNIGKGLNDADEITKCKKKWFPIAKGGEYRKWYGNLFSVINMEGNGVDIKTLEKNNYRLRDPRFYFKKGIAWSRISMVKPGFRMQPEGYLFGENGPSVFLSNELYYYIFGFLGSKLSAYFLEMINPTLTFQTDDIGNLPILFSEDKNIFDKVSKLVKENVRISKKEWDDYETSIDFEVHPFLNEMNKTKYIKDSYEKWSQVRRSQIELLRENEEEINGIFIKIYDLEDQMSCEVNKSDVTLRSPDLEKDVKSFISYAIGCIFGRYSIDKKGLIYAGGEFNPTIYKGFPVDIDNILPVLNANYFENDIVTKFIYFVRVVFSQETLEENLDYIADSIGRKKHETTRETIRRYLLNDFFKNHVQTYQKRPIYWLFTSGKEKAFNCLVYMHRYDKTTLSRIRTDYVHEVQQRMDAEKNDLLDIINGDSTVKEIAAAKKELKSLEKKIDELNKYDELLHHMADQQIEIDLDDGVKHNYELFKGLVAPIK